MWMRLYKIYLVTHDCQGPFLDSNNAEKSLAGCTVMV